MSDGNGVRVVRNEQEQRYEAYMGDELAGVLTFVPTDAGLDLQHTVVEPDHRGHGIGEELAVAALSAARESGERIIPTCRYLSDYIQQHPEHADLVAA